MEQWIVGVFLLEHYHKLSLVSLLSQMRNRSSFDEKRGEERDVADRKLHCLLFEIETKTLKLYI